MAEAAPASPVASAGKIHLLDLGTLKQRLGPKWERMAQHVQMFFEAAIRRSLAPGDTFCRCEELSYLVMFRDLNAAEAELRCAAISEEVCKRLFGENGEAVSLRNLVAHVGLASAPTGIKQRDALNERLEKEGKEIVVTRRPEPKAPDVSALNFRVAVSGTVGARQRVALEEVTFSYRPLWDSSNHVVLKYLCQPVFSSGAEFPSGFWTAEDEANQTILDLYVLHECLKHVHRLKAEGLRIILAVPVHFNTIGRARNWRDYLDTLLQVAKEIRRDLAFVVFGIDQGVPHIRLSQELPKLSQMAYRVFCVADRSQAMNGRFARTGVHGVGVSIDEKEDELHAAAKIRDVVKDAQAAVIDSFVLGLKSTSLTLIALNAGVRYLEGSAIRLAVDDPRHGFVQGVEDLYKTKRVTT